MNTNHSKTETSTESKGRRSLRSVACEIDTMLEDSGINPGHEGPQLVKKLGVKVQMTPEGPEILCHKTDQIKNVDELMAAANYSKEEWEVTRAEANVWNQASGDNGVIPLWQVKAKLQPKPMTQNTLIDMFKSGAEAAKAALRLPSSKLAKKKNCEKGVMVEFALPDLHLGKLAWNEETQGGNWDLQIAEQTWKEAVLDLSARSPKAEEAWLVVGNDFYNVDNLDETTTNGTPQNEDGRWQRTFRKGTDLITWTITLLRKKFPKVKVIVVYGNHDHQRAFYLGEYLSAYFRLDNSVEIDNRPCPRKYFIWGNTGIGFTHGDRLKAADLGNLCQNEAREIWGTTKRFELHLGHLHQNLVKSIGGVLVRWIPALCPPDAWHAKSGYTMSEKAAMLFEYDQNGLRNMHMHYPDEKLFA